MLASEIVPALKWRSNGDDKMLVTSYEVLPPGARVVIGEMVAIVINDKGLQIDLVDGYLHYPAFANFCGDQRQRVLKILGQSIVQEWLALLMIDVENRVQGMSVWTGEDLTLVCGYAPKHHHIPENIQTSWFG